MKEILLKHSRTAVIVVLILLAIIAARSAYIYFYHTLPPQLVTITVSYAPEPPCRKDSPLYMQILNDSYREVLGASFNLSVKVDEHSDSIVRLSEDDYSTDSVIKARSSHEGCWSYPKLYTNKHDPNKLIYEVTQQVIKFSN
jgi:hypothetical protein